MINVKRVFLISTVSFVLLPAIVISGTVDLSKTGQTSCYDTDGNEIDCKGTGQDGEIQAGVAWPALRFSDNGNGTVTDNLTGLMWTQDAYLTGDVKTLQESIDYVSGMNTGTHENFGYTDWRFSNINELESLVNAEEPDNTTWLNTQGFTNVDWRYGYLSSTSYGIGLNQCGIGMEEGGLGHAGIVNGTFSSVWPVRAGQQDTTDINYNANIWKTGQGQAESYFSDDDGDLQRGVAWPSPRFKDNGDSTITDTLTGLMWTQDANLPNGTKTWQDALDYVAGMNTGTYENFGYTNWRLPNRKDLHSLTDYSQMGPALPSGYPFTNLPSPSPVDGVSFFVYWSSTTTSNRTTHAFYLEMYSGACVPSKKTNTCYVWPVRAGSVIRSTIKPDIKANNSDSSITIKTSETLSITVSLSDEGNAGTKGDWWVVVSAPNGWYYYSLSTSWTSAGSSYTGLVPTYQGALFDLGSYSVLNTSGLSEGTYTFYFAIDTKMNGSLDTGSIYSDSVEVKVTP